MSDALPLPGTEGIEELIAHLGRDRFFGHVSERLDRVPHLSQIGTAVPAHPQVQLETHALQEGLSALQVVGA